MKVLIAGGGIAGLALFHALSREGIEAEIFERVAHFDHVGGGLILKSPATLSLERNQLLPQVRARGLAFTRHEILDETGNQLGEIDFGPLYDRGLTPGVLIHRAAFHEILESTVPPGRLHMGTGVERVELRDDGVTLEVRGRGQVRGDLLVGADGLHSVVREQLWGASPHPLGFRSYRWVVPNTVGAEHFMEFMGKGMALGVLPVSREELFGWLSVHATPGSPSAAPDAASFKAYLGQFTHPLVLQAMQELTDAIPVLCTDIHEVTLEEYYQGRCVLLGDAAHAMSPSMGTGSAMAMGDALILAQQLGRVARGEVDHTLAFHEYYLHRFPKVEAMRSLTRGVDADHHAGARSLIDYRNARLTAWLHDSQKTAADLANSLGGEL